MDGVWDAESPLYVGVRWLTFAAIFMAIGAVGFSWLLRALARRAPCYGETFVAPASARAARLGKATAIALGIAAALRLVAQVFAVTPELDAELVAGLLSRTLWGKAWWTQLAATVALAVAFSLEARAVAARPIATLAAIALAITPALSGHAASTAALAPLPLIADGLHVLGAATWLGTLAFVVAVGLPAARRLPPAERGPAIAQLVDRFSGLALVAAAVASATGVFAAWIHLERLDALWSSPYGRVLLAKLSVLVLLFGAGAYNWRRVKPSLGTETAADRLRVSASIELGIAVLVLLVTAALVAIPPPADAAPAP